MSWVILCVLSWGVATVAVPRRNWRILWPAGLIALVTVYAIDSTFVSLGAYVYSSRGPMLNGIPLFYMLSTAAGGIILTNFKPRRQVYRLPYIMLMAGVLFLAEWVMIREGQFYYWRWSYWRSYWLNVSGFAIVLWLAEALGIERSKKV